jgi:hypothetical protein
MPVRRYYHLEHSDLKYDGGTTAKANLEFNILSESKVTTKVSLFVYLQYYCLREIYQLS